MSFFLALLLFFDVQAMGESPPLEAKFKTYPWPTVEKPIKLKPHEERLKLLGQEMNRFSTSVGKCYRWWEKRGNQAKSWLSTRQGRIEHLSQSPDPVSFCKQAKTVLLGEMAGCPTDSGASAFSQYANCMEGSWVGGCLALDYGFSPKEVLICGSAAEDHAFALIPEKEGALLDKDHIKDHQYCLIDRNNPYRCGVSIEKITPDPEVIGFGKIDFNVPGRVDFGFSKTRCYPMSSMRFLGIPHLPK